MPIVTCSDMWERSRHCSYLSTANMPLGCRLAPICQHVCLDAPRVFLMDSEHGIVWQRTISGEIPERLNLS